MPDQPTVADREPERAETVLRVFDSAFGELLAQDPAAFRVKFRKMAASAFAFYRGTAALLQATPQLDMARLWMMLLLSFDVVFVTLSLWTFESVMTE